LTNCALVAPLVTTSSSNITKSRNLVFMIVC
jgi:hypothetical protein